MIIGAGPAGAVAAIALARLHRVVLVDRVAEPRTRIGESLAPAARRILADLGLWQSFLDQGHAPCHANLSLWGSDDPVVADHLRDPDGPGWHLDRARFDAWLRREAGRAGAALLCPAEPVAVDGVGAPVQHGWHVRLRGEAGQTADIRAAVLIDAGGRQAALSRRLGARRVVTDRLVCGWLHGRDSNPTVEAGRTRVQSAPDGWWYTAPLPGGRRVLAFHTDADLPAAAGLRDTATLLASAHAQPGLGAMLARSGFTGDGEPGFTAAHSALTNPPCGTAVPGDAGSAAWLACGDAALSFDPLSSQGLFNALYTGLAAAEAASRLVPAPSFTAGSTADRGAALRDHADRLAGIRTAYQDHLRLFYGAEQRWPDAPFWQRRR
jgi:flavin-dependent dehydrogenase